MDAEAWDRPSLCAGWQVLDGDVSALTTFVRSFWPGFESCNYLPNIGSLPEVDAARSVDRVGVDAEAVPRAT